MKKELKRAYRNIINTLSGKKDYGKLVVITRSRTGSNLLISLLNNHDEVQVYGEHFKFLSGASTESHFKKIFPSKSVTRWIGFKLFYYHPEDSNDTSIWDIIEKDKEFRIIHLIRKNTLRVHISKVIANKTGIWKATKDSTTMDKKVSLDVDELLEEIESTEKWIESTRKKFSNHETLEVTYEDLVEDQPAVMEKVFKFLNLNPVSASSQLKRQNPEGIEEIVTNYSEIQEKLSKTAYAFMLE